MFDFTGYTQDELEGLLQDQRDQMTVWGRIYHMNSHDKVALQEHDKAEQMCLDIIEEMRRRK